MVIASFTSKANTLKFLQEKITRSKIEQSFDFTIEEWQKSESIICKSSGGDDGGLSLFFYITSFRKRFALSLGEL